MDSLNSALTKSRGRHAIYVQLPNIAAHQNHIVTVESAVSKRINPMVKAKIYEYVGLGATTVSFMKTMLTQFVIKTLCVNDPVQPSHHDRSYFPSKKTIQNHIHAAIVAGRYSALDQDNLARKIEDWKNTSDSMFFLRKCGETSSPGVDTIPLNVGKIFQSKDKSEHVKKVKMMKTKNLQKKSQLFFSFTRPNSNSNCLLVMDKWFC